MDIMVFTKHHVQAVCMCVGHRDADANDVCLYSIISAHALLLLQRHCGRRRVEEMPQHDEVLTAS